MNRKAFRQLLKKYLDDSCTSEERKIVDQWYHLIDKDYTTLSTEKLNEIEDRLWAKVQGATTGYMTGAYRKKTTIIWWKYSAAASFVGIVLFGSLWLYNNKHVVSATSIVSAKGNKGYLNETNSTKTPKKIQLEDGSSVIIYPGSKLAYPKHFSGPRREVYLEGEAFFTVSKSPGRSFYVYNKQIVTQVLGTSFGISNKQGQLEVVVKTGKVAVYENREQLKLNAGEQKSNGVIITPNQKVTYYQQERHFVTSVADKPVPVLKESGEQKNVAPDFNYREASVTKVLQDLENTYELEIVIENEKIKNCLFTGDLTDENLFNKLEGICLVFGADYEVKGTKILLKGGKDCTTN
jgi:ferric-dicitrate binding protein FerR (iron transport regulator)